MMAANTRRIVTGRIARKYSSFLGAPKTLEDCYKLFYLDETCSLEDLTAAHAATVKRYSNNIQIVMEIDKAYLRVLRDLRKDPSFGKQKSTDKTVAAEYLKGRTSETKPSFLGQRSGGSSSIESRVEALVDIHMDEEEIQHLPGFGKPLKPKPYDNPFIDSVSYKLNEIMINQNVGTEWIEIKKDIKTTLDKAKYVLTDYRKKLERRSIDEKEWQAALKDFRDKITQVNKKVSSYNLSVPVLRMQIMEYKADRLLEQLQSQWEVDRKTWKKS